MRVMHLTVVFMLVAGSLSYVAAQTKPAKPSAKRATQTYDTQERTEKKICDLAVWSLEAQVAGRERDSSYLVYETNEYMEKVVAILQKRRPQPIGYEDYQSLETSGSDITDKGEWFANVVLNLGLKFREVSRTSSGPIETIIYEWKNANGSHVVGTFQNRRLVGKAQTGLK